MALTNKLYKSTDTFLTLPDIRSEVDTKIDNIGEQVSQVIQKHDNDYVTACQSIIEHKNSLMKNMYDMFKSRDEDYKAFALQKHCTNEGEMSMLRKDASFFYKRCNQLKEKLKLSKVTIDQLNSDIFRLERDLKAQQLASNALPYASCKLINYISEALNKSADLKITMKVLIDTLTKFTAPLSFDKISGILENMPSPANSPVNKSIKLSLRNTKSKIKNNSFDQNSTTIEYGTSDEPYNNKSNKIHAANISRLKSKLFRAQKTMSSKYFKTSELESVFVDCIEEIKKLHPLPLQNAIKKCSDNILQGRVLTKEEKIEVSAAFVSNERILKVIYEALFPKRASYLETIPIGVEKYN